MKKLALLLSICLLLLACHDEPTPTTQSTNTQQPPKLPTLLTGTKTVFKKIEILPAGIQNIFGKLPSLENGFYKFSFPRNDLKVVSDGISIDPRLAFTTWFAIKPMDTSYGMLMGDLVLLETEFSAVLKKLDEKGIDISAIHNHLLNEKPKVIYLHISAMGNPVEVLTKIKDVLSVTTTPFISPPVDTTISTDWGKVEEILGYKGKKEGSILKFAITRRERIKDEGMELPENFGINSVINFKKMGSKAAVTGDFVLTPSEVNTVQKILTRNNILVTALHGHMLFEEPRIFFMHFWAVDDAEKLATALHEALSTTNHEGNPPAQ